MSTEPSYLYIAADRGGVVRRTVPAGDGINVDLADDGRVVGVESLTGPVSTDVLRSVIRAVRWPAVAAHADQPQHEFTFDGLIEQAITDPTALAGAQAPGESVQAWRARAVMAIVHTMFGVDPEGHYAGTPASRALFDNASLRSQLAAARGDLSEDFHSASRCGVIGAPPCPGCALAQVQKTLDAFMYPSAEGKDMAARVTSLSDKLVQAWAVIEFYKSRRREGSAWGDPPPFVWWASWEDSAWDGDEAYGDADYAMACAMDDYIDTQAVHREDINKAIADRAAIAADLRWHQAGENQWQLISARHGDTEVRVCRFTIHMPAPAPATAGGTR